MAWQSGFKPEDLSFIAEEVHISIIPSFTEPAPLAMLTGNFGPFIAGLPVEVPLWVALKLKEDGKCRIQPPPWMDVDRLKNLLGREKANADSFVEIPFYYIEMSRLLLSGWAREDIDKADLVEGLIEDIEQARREKILAGQKVVLNEAATKEIPRLIDLTHVASMEVNMLRATFMKAIDKIVEAGEMQQVKDRAAAAPGGRGGAGAGGSAGASSTGGRAIRGTGYSGVAASYSSSSSSSSSSNFDASGGGGGGGLFSSSSSAAPAPAPAPAAPAIKRAPLRKRGVQQQQQQNAAASAAAEAATFDSEAATSILPPEHTLGAAAEAADGADEDLPSEGPRPTKLRRTADAGEDEEQEGRAGTAGGNDGREEGGESGAMDDGEGR